MYTKEPALKATPVSVLFHGWYILSKNKAPASHTSRCQQLQIDPRLMAEAPEGSLLSPSVLADPEEESSQKTCPWHRSLQQHSTAVEISFMIVPCRSFHSAGSVYKRSPYSMKYDINLVADILTQSQSSSSTHTFLSDCRAGNLWGSNDSSWNRIHVLSIPYNTIWRLYDTETKHICMIILTKFK